MFFEHNHISDTQQKQIISDLEKRSVNYIIVSNRAYSDEEGMGHFGKTHCLMLARYIEDFFEPVVQFGDWDSSPDYMANHATRVWKRVEKN